MIYVVLGMHKSGTTLVSQLFHRSGISMLDDAGKKAGYDEGHKFEDPRFRELNLQLLGSRGAFSLDIPLDAPLNVTTGVESRAEDLISERNASLDRWGFKDPRTTLTYPFWRERLPEHRIVGVYRSPFEVWSHYGGRLRNLWSVLKHWSEYNLRLLAYLAESDTPGFLVEYEALMTSDHVLEGLEAFLEVDVEDVRDPSLYRSRIEPGPAARAMTRGLSAFLPEDPIALWERLRETSRGVGMDGGA